MSAWLLRVFGWSIVVLCGLRILIDPSGNRLDSLIFSARIRGESAAARLALHHAIGLSKVFDPARFTLSLAAPPPRIAPLWFSITDQTAADYRDATVWVWLDESGNCRLPALASPQLPDFDWKSLPEEFLFPESNGKSTLVAMTLIGSRSGVCRSALWVHEVGRWKNVVRMQSGVQPSIEFKPDLVNGVLVGVKSVDGKTRLTWNPATRSFDPAGAIPGTVTQLELLPDQVGEPAESP